MTAPDTDEFNIEPLLALRDLTRSEIEQRFHIDDGDIVRDVTYEKATGLDRVDNDESYPTTFYFRDGQLVVVYVDGEALQDAKRDLVHAKMGPPEAKLRSRAGKRSVLQVYPATGFAFSSAGDDFDFLEVFPPTTLQQYQEQIYEEPGPFIR